MTWRTYLFLLPLLLGTLISAASLLLLLSPSLDVQVLGRASPLVPCRFAHSVAVYPYTLAASNELAWPLVP